MLIKEISLTHTDLVDISQRMHELTQKRESQGYLEWLLFRAVSDVKKVNLFEELQEQDTIMC